MKNLNWGKIMKWLSGTALAVMLFGLPNCSLAQDSLEKSEIVKITDADKAFFATVDEIRSDFQKIAESSPAFIAAEQAAMDLAKDPDNNDLKRKMVAARSQVLHEKSIVLRKAAENADRLESVYANLKKQIDGQIADAQAAISLENEQEREEVNFLSEALDELLKLEPHLQAAGPEMVSSNLQAALLMTQEEKEKLNEFKGLIEVAEMQMELAKDSVNLHQRRMGVLAQIRLQASDEYAALRIAMANARTDQVIFASIAKNDLSFLKTIEDEERLAEMGTRQPFKYDSPTKSSSFRSGYRFGELPNRINPDVQVLSSNQETIDRVKRKVESYEQQTTTTASGSTIISTSNSERNKD
jgi:hypothetical protein